MQSANQQSAPSTSSLNVTDVGLLCSGSGVGSLWGSGLSALGLGGDLGGDFGGALWALGGGDRSLIFTFFSIKICYRRS